MVDGRRATRNWSVRTTGSVVCELSIAPGRGADTLWRAVDVLVAALTGLEIAGAAFSPPSVDSQGFDGSRAIVVVTSSFYLDHSR